MSPALAAPRVTVAIPLYRSARFVDDIVRNVLAMPGPDVEVLISDRHGLDDALAQLSARFAHDSRVRCLEARDAVDWTVHINELLLAARGEYFRVLPHDDLSPPGSLEALIAALDADPSAILAYGPTLAVDLQGGRMPVRDSQRPHPLQQNEPWPLAVVLDMFWDGHFDGAFKGLVRRRPLLEAGHSIVPTQDLIFAERAFLFGVCLLGPLRFVPEATYVKRFHEGSVHAQWRIRRKHVLSVSRVMLGHVHEYIADTRLRRLARAYLVTRCAAQLAETPRLPARVTQPLRALAAHLRSRPALQTATYPSWTREGQL